MGPALGAAAKHLGASAVVAAVVAWLVFGLWYPAPYAALAGGFALFGLVVMVDAVCGPLMTLVVFDRRKPCSELARDIGIIVTLQFHERALAQDLPQQILRLKRELDEVWLLPTEERAALSILMPLGDASTAEGYITRLEGWMQDKNSQTLSQAGVFAHVVTLDSSATLHTLAKIHTIAHA